MFWDVCYMYDMLVFGQIDYFKVVNLVVEIDFYGQVNVEMVCGCQFSGIGGVFDFMCGVVCLCGGVLIVVLLVIVVKGKVLCIVLCFVLGNIVMVVCLEFDIVVIEYGMVEICDFLVGDCVCVLVEIVVFEFWEELRVVVLKF